MIDAMRDVPAMVVDRLSNVLAWNRAALEVIADFDDPENRNLARHYFLDPAARQFYADWETVAHDAVALLHRASAEYADDAELAALVNDLRAASPDFDRSWTTQNVQNRAHCLKHLNHPTAGRLTFTLESLQLPADPDQYVLTYTPADPTTQAALETLLATRSPLSGSYDRAKRK